MSKKEDAEKKSAAEKLRIKQANEGLIASFSSEASGELVKKAEADISKITKLRSRDRMVWEQVLPREDIVPDELQVQMTMPEEQVFLQPMQGTSPGAVMVPLDTITPTETIFAEFYPVFFARVMTRQVVKDVEKCVNYAKMGIDLQKQISDDMAFDVSDTVDYSAFTGCVDPAIGTEGVVNPRSGIKQNVVVNGGLTRLNLARSCKHMLRTPSKWAPKLMLINVADKFEIIGQFTREQAGGDLSQDLLQNGMERLGNFFGGVEVYATIKDEICPEGTVYLFAAPNELGVFKSRHDFVMHVERKKSIWVEMFGFAMLGSSIGNTNGVIKIRFTGINDTILAS